MWLQCIVCILCVMLFVTGWRSEVNKLTERLRQLEKEKGITQKICEDQENELKVHKLLCIIMYVHTTVPSYIVSVLLCSL